MTSERSDDEKWMKESLRQAAEKQDWAVALEHARGIARLRPNEAKPRYNLGVVLMRLGRFEEACWAFRHSLDMDAGYEKARQGLEEAKKRIAGRNESTQTPEVAVEQQTQDGTTTVTPVPSVNPEETGPKLDITAAMEKENAIRQAVARRIEREKVESEDIY